VVALLRDCDHIADMTETDPRRLSEAEWREKLGPERYHILREAGTERAFTGQFNVHKANGVYVCGGCGAPLFASDTKYDSGSGWPSFFAPISDDAVAIRVDTSHGMVREEVVCARCDGHLGHRFPDGPAPTGQRFCMNSASLDFSSSAD
jgi:peptide-methionine (R)-S-oxide reductase